ncbi:MAG TPA: hypothetical protein VER14_04110, partial [Phototrophicaceae bacterium]|nr:hypothetical protein [Phototrophicaceae bacterium]
KIVVPGIIICLIGGTIMLLLAFSFYPEKHVNANLNGNCYEFLDTAYIKYKNLETEKEKAVKMLQVQAIGNPSILVPITFSGTNIQVNDFMANNHINETGRQILGNNNPSIDKTIIRGTILNGDLKKLVNNFPNSDTGLFSKTVPYGLGIQPNPHITSEESQHISKNIEQLMERGLKEIISEKDGVKVAECRSKIVYNDNKNNKETI